MLFMESGEKRRMFSSIKRAKMWKRDKKIALYVCWPQWGKFHLIYISKTPQLELLKNKKNVLPFDSMDSKSESKMQVDHKKGEKNVSCSFFMQNHWIKREEVSSVLGWQIYDYKWT